MIGVRETPPADRLFAGAATAELPVPDGVPLAGYADRRGNSIGIHDVPQVAVLVLRQHEKAVVLAAVDLVAVDGDFAAEVATAAGVEPESLLLAASHTHSAPAGVIDRPLSPGIDVSYRERVRAVIADTIRRALAEPRPARLRLARVRTEGIAANRNLPDKPVDNRVTTVSVLDQQGRLIACVVHFPCHPTVLGADNLLVSADFVGPLRDHFRQSASLGDAPIVFLNGASADVSTRFTRRGQDFAEVERLGAKLAKSASSSLHLGSQVVPRPMLCRSSLSDLPAKVVPTIETASSRVAVCKRELDAARQSRQDPKHIRRLETKVQGATADLARSNGRGLSASPVRLFGVRIGPVAVLAVSAEVSSHVAAAIEADSPFEDTIVVGLANGYCGYVVGDCDGEGETYESLTSPFASEAAPHLVRDSLSLLREMAGSGA